MDCFAIVQKALEHQTKDGVPWSDPKRVHLEWGAQLEATMAEEPGYSPRLELLFDAMLEREWQIVQGPIKPNWYYNTGWRH